MPIKLPDLQTTDLNLLTACATITTEDPKIKNLFKSKDKTFLSAFRKGKTQSFIWVLIGLREYGHLHIDIFKEGAINGVPDRSRLISIKETLKELENFLGLDVIVTIIGQYVVRVSKLPKYGLIRSSFIEIKEDDLVIRTRGSVFELEGAPISKITWTLDDSKKKIKVDLKSVLAGKIDEDYLIRFAPFLGSAFRQYVLEVTPDAA